MSNYTTTIRMICKNLTKENDPYKSIDAARPLIFDFDYPLPDDTQFKARFEKKFLMFYFMSEICCETYALWKFWLNEKLNRIMPYYIDKYNSIISKDKIFNDTDYSVSDNRSDTGSSSGSTSAKNKFSDTPQGGLSGLENDRYLTRAEINSGTAENNSNSTSKLNRHVTGKSGGKSYAEMSMEYRDAIINIEEEIINDCADLFMMIY